jgi:hypothetical protein
VGPADRDAPAPSHAYAAAGANAPRFVKDEATGIRKIECPRCLTRSDADADACGHCGFPFTMEATDAMTPQNIGKWATASLVMGILAVVLSFGWAVGAMLGPLAVVFGVMALNRMAGLQRPPPDRGLAWAGIIMGLIGLAISALWLTM